jgi:arabinogalactan oligomer / maltooligosaccharide transport system substrate-binding protein
MLNKQMARVGTVLLAAVAVALLVLASGAPAARDRAGAGAATTIRIWTDQDRKAAVDRVASAWGNSKGVAVEVVVKPFGNIRDDLKTVQAGQAPDVVVAAHDWTGQLAADGLVVPILPKKAVLKLVPKYARDAFSYGTGVARLYGMPTTLENVGLFVNTSLVKVPKSWAQLERSALAFKKKSPDNLAIAVQQGANGDAYHMYPFFSGLCGYVFGKTKGGALNPSNIGLSNKVFLKNTSLIDKWNREGLITSKVDGSTAQNAFLKGQAAFWVTGPWNIDTVRKAGVKFQIVQIPKIKCRAVPFLGVNGFMVTKFAASHGVESPAKDLVANYMANASSQQDLAAANGRYPANVTAGKRITDTALRQIGRASTGGVPMPNIPQMGSVWDELGGAWVKSTKGSGATPARSAFSTAAANIRKKIASG